jgi:uncharacterized protein YndB with AHSA1/START domain
MTTTQDIKQELVVKAPRAKVWNVLTTPEGWTGWFSEGVKGNFTVGETMTLTFEGFGDCYAKVVEREEGTSFAYKWHPGEDCELDKYPESEMTTVRFSLQDHPEGTLLTLIESGFENLPESRRAKCAEMNTMGWGWELTELQVFAEHGEVQALGLDEIVRERVYATSQEKLWDLVATPEGLKKWFVSEVEGEFVPGNIATLHFDCDSKAKGGIKVITSNRPESFSMKWHPGQVDGCTWDQFPESEATTTTFTLTPVEGGTKLQIVEAGFKNVPKDRRTKCLQLNNQGWSKCLDLIGGAVG